MNDAERGQAYINNLENDEDPREAVRIGITPSVLDKRLSLIAHLQNVEHGDFTEPSFLELQQMRQCNFFQVETEVNRRHVLSKAIQCLNTIMGTGMIYSTSYKNGLTYERLYQRYMLKDIKIMKSSESVLGHRIVYNLMRIIELLGANQYTTKRALYYNNTDLFDNDPVTLFICVKY